MSWWRDGLLIAFPTNSGGNYINPFSVVTRTWLTFSLLTSSLLLRDSLSSFWLADFLLVSVPAAPLFRGIFKTSSTSVQFMLKLRSKACQKIPLIPQPSANVGRSLFLKELAKGTIICNDLSYAGTRGFALRWREIRPDHNITKPETRLGC